MSLVLTLMEARLLWEPLELRKMCITLSLLFFTLIGLYARWEYYERYERVVPVSKEYRLYLDRLFVDAVRSQVRLEREEIRKDIVAKKLKPIVAWMKNKAPDKTEAELKEILYHVYSESETPLLLLAIISVESTFDKDEKNNQGCRGLGQIHPVNFPELKKEGIISSTNDLHKVREGVVASNYVLSSCLNKARGNTKTALKYYSASYSSDKYMVKVLAEYSKLKSISHEA